MTTTQNYKRSSHCECAKYKDRNEMNLQERLQLKVFWQDGYIHENGTAYECKCHRTCRLGKRYDRLAIAQGLPTFQELSKLQYLGNSESYNKLRALPKIVYNHELKDVLVYVYGGNGCQKTTTLAKIVYETVLDRMTTEYINFADLIELFTANDTEKINEIFSRDWLIVDDCFEGETINFKTVYNQFYNAILKRKKPTILATSYKPEELKNAKGIPSYNPEMLEKLFIKVAKYNTAIAFNDNIDKLQLTAQKIDIWSM